jgi:hypothetical protein
MANLKSKNLKASVKFLKTNKTIIMKWKQALADYNLTEETISHGLKKKIKEYRELEVGIDELKNSINDESTPEDDLEELQEDYKKVLD